MEQTGFKVWCKPREIVCCSTCFEGWKEERGAILGVKWAVKMQRKALQAGAKGAQAEASTFQVKLVGPLSHPTASCLMR